MTTLCKGKMGASQIVTTLSKGKAGRKPDLNKTLQGQGWGVSQIETHFVTIQRKL